MLSADGNPPLNMPTHGLAARSRAQTAGLVWAIGVLACLIWFALLGARPLFRPDEGRYAEIPREMAASGDWLVPRLDGVVYVEKPPLQYWLTATSYRVFGEHIWSARLVPGLAAVLGILLVGWGARRLWGPGRGIMASAICASAPLYFLLGQLLTLDMLFTLFLTAALITFCIGQAVRDDQRRSLRWMLACWIAIAGAVLTKGIAALAIPAVVIAAYSFWQKDTRVWRASRIGPGLAVCAVLAAPWFIAMSRVVPDFAQFFFIHEHLMRYATRSADRFQPWWYFVPILILGILPWVPQLASAWRHRELDSVPRGSFDARRLLWVWAVVVLLFFSASKSKLIPYVLPIVPVVALLIAGSGASATGRNAKLSAYLSLAAAVMLAIGLIAFAFAARQEKQQALADLMTPGLVAMSLALLAGAIAALWQVRKGRIESGLASVAGGWFAGCALLIGWAAAAAGPLYSAAPMAAVLAARLPAPSHVYSVSYYEQTLPFYLRRTIDVVDYQGELEFGMRLDPARAISLEDFAARWRTDLDACAAMPRADYNRLLAAGLPMTILLQDPRYLLVARR
jgi:4-amino-4-deoxy-L-arabinose transferase-like glycosyltransferase